MPPCRLVLACLPLALSVCLAAPACHAADGVHLLTAAHIHTEDAGQPMATAIAWDVAGRVIAVGDAADLANRYPDAERIDVGEATVIPGLIDAHGHVMDLGLSLMRVDLVGTRDVADVLQRLRAYASTLAPVDWLLGGGWDQNDWADTSFPTSAELDAAFPDRPVWLDRVDGHAGWANSAALRVLSKPDAGKSLLDADAFEGGRVVRAADGRPTGILVDGAMKPMLAVLPAIDEAHSSEALERALAAAVRDGLTGVHDMGTSREALARYARFADEGRLPLRIDAYADGDQGAFDDRCTQGPYRHPGGRLQMDGVKLYIDGALGSRGAAMLADYSDEPGNRGLLVTEPDVYEVLLQRAKSCGLQVATHAIGDRGNRLVLDAYARVLRDAAGNDHRWRIEHAQIVAAADIPRFAELGVIASMQPTHATSDMPWAGTRVGETRLAGAYAWRRFLDSGAHIALGSDFPVESPDPRLGLYAAVTRQDRDGQPPGGWRADQALTAAEALRGFTADAAWAGHDEAEVGRLMPGLRADFVVLDADPLRVSPAQLDDLKVLSTWVDGRPVYEAE